MEFVLILALIAFGAATVVAITERSWAIALIGLGLFLELLPRAL